jgi:hypothetical protein
MGDLLGEAAAVAAHALADRLKGLEACGTGGGVDGDTFGRAVIDGDKDSGRPFASPAGGQIGAPT